MTNARLELVLAVVCAGAVGGCGLTVPEMQEFYQAREEQQLDENYIINRVKCELHLAVQKIFKSYAKGNYTGNDISWFKKWGAKVNMKITVDEKSALKPGASFKKLLPTAHTTLANGEVLDTAQSFSLGLGLNVSSDATRVEQVEFTYRFKDLLAERPIVSCEQQGNFLIKGDLKIGQFINNKIFLAAVPGTVTPPYGGVPYSVFSYQITFVVSYGGGITPSWTLVQVSANPDGDFASVSRIRTHDLTITLAAVDQGPPTTVARLSPDGEAVHMSQLIGQAVAIRNQSQR
jgi:hypothetical protein